MSRLSRLFAWRVGNCSTFSQGYLPYLHSRLHGIDREKTIRDGLHDVFTLGHSENKQLSMVVAVAREGEKLEWVRIVDCALLWKLVLVLLLDVDRQILDKLWIIWILDS